MMYVIKIGTKYVGACGDLMDRQRDAIKIDEDTRATIGRHYTPVDSIVSDVNGDLCAACPRFVRLRPRSDAF